MGDDALEYTFPLRPDLTIRLALPIDLSHAEVDRLARFLHSLPFEERRTPQQAYQEWLASRQQRSAATAPQLAESSIFEPIETSPYELAIPELPPGAQACLEVSGQLVDLWSTMSVAPGVSPDSGAAVVSGAIEPWDVLAATRGRALHVGSTAESFKENGAIVAARTRSVAVILREHGIGTVSVPKPSPGAQQLEGIMGVEAVRPWNMVLSAPSGARIYRVAWGCRTQELKVENLGELPAARLEMRFVPTKPEARIMVYLAIWIGEASSG